MNWIFFIENQNNLGLADDDSDAGEQNENDIDMVKREAPLPVCNKPFVVKKFRDALPCKCTVRNRWSSSID